MILLLFMTVKLDRMYSSDALDSFEYSFNCSLFRAKKTLNSKKYGVDLIRFTHATNTVIHSSTKVDGKKRLFIVDDTYALFF